MAFISGVGGSATVGGITLCVGSWSITDSCDMIDVTNSCGGGFRNFLSGIRNWTATVKTWFEGTVSQTSAPVNIRPGIQGTWTFTLGTSGKFYGGTAIVKSDTIENDVAGAVTFNVELQGSGPLTYPTP